MTIVGKLSKSRLTNELIIGFRGVVKKGVLEKRKR